MSIQKRENYYYGHCSLIVHAIYCSSGGARAKPPDTRLFAMDAISPYAALLLIIKPACRVCGSPRGSSVDGSLFEIYLVDGGRLRYFGAFLLRKKNLLGSEHRIRGCV